MNDDTAVDNKSSIIETGWKSTPTLSELKENYDDAQLEHTTQQAKIDEWVAYLNVTGVAKIAKVTGRSNVQPKLIRKQAEWRYPTLTEPFLSTDDVFNVYPITAEDVKSAQQNQLVLNNQFNTKIKKVKFIDDYVRSAVDEGTVIVRVGWVSEEATIKEEVPVYEYSPDMTGDGLKRYSALMALQQSNPKKYKEFTNPGVEQGIKTLLETGQVLIPTQVGTETQKRIIEIKNHPTVTVCDSKNIIIDPSCEGDISKAGFIIFNFETSKSALRKAGKYSNIDSINIEGSSPLNDPDYTGGKDNANFNFKDEPRTKFWASEYWGFWDIHGTGTVEPIVVTWAGTTIIQMEVSPFPDKELPFVFASLMPVRRSAYGEPDGELLRDNQQIIGAVSRGMIDLMGKSAAGQTGMRKDFLDVTNARKFREGKDYEYNANTDPRVGVFQHTYPEIPQSAYNMLNIQNAEAESFSGVKAFSAGITGQALGDVAAGVRGALDAASKRELGILRRLAAGVVEIGRKIISLNAQFLSEEEVVRITDEEFVTIRRDDLAGNFDLKLTISTAEEDDQKAKELAFMLQTMGNNADPDIVRMLLANIARLRKMPDLARALENFKPQPNPLAEMKAQLEIKLLEAQIAKEQALAQQHGSNANLTTAQVASEQAATLLDFTKVDTEKAKARNLLSDADNKDLNYVEQESGVEQERNLQKIRGQAEAQAKTKVIEAMLKAKTDTVEARAEGGPVRKGKTYLVGENGPEMLAPSNGADPYVIGQHGPQIITPNTNGTVIPNEEIGLSELAEAERQLHSNNVSIANNQNTINNIQRGWVDHQDTSDGFANFNRTAQAAADIIPDGVISALRRVATGAVLKAAGPAEFLMSPSDANAGEFDSPHAVAHKNKMLLAEANQNLLRGVVTGGRKAK